MGWGWVGWAVLPLLADTHRHLQHVLERPNWLRAAQLAHRSGAPRFRLSPCALLPPRYFKYTGMRLPLEYNTVGFGGGIGGWGGAS